MSFSSWFLRTVGVISICGWRFISADIVIGPSRLRGTTTATASTDDSNNRLLSSSTTITTTACPSIRTQELRARLDVFYYYLVEFAEDATADLAGVERAIANQLASALNECDEEKKHALYAVQVLGDDAHRFADEGKLSLVPVLLCVS